MNVTDMNVSTIKKTALRSVLCVSASAALSACAFNPPSDPDSPLNPRVAALVAEHTAYPRLEDFPAAPANLPTAAQIGAQVTSLEGTGSRLDTQVAAVDWQIEDDTDEFIASVKSRLEQGGVEAPTAETPAEIEAFADSLRARAKAPPPVDRPL